MKVSELTGAQLDYWVAEAESFEAFINPGGPCMVVDPASPANEPRWLEYEPSTEWAQGGPLIEKYRIEILHFGARGEGGNPWEAQMGGDSHYIDQYSGDAMGGTTPLVAAMRAYVESRFGDEVPDEAPAK